jgi:ABC-type oligopeptide transport system substrate-binding subunit
VGILNRHPRDVDLGDRRLREALNLAVDRERVIAEGLAATPTPSRR